MFVFMEKDFWLGCEWDYVETHPSTISLKMRGRTATIGRDSIEEADLLFGDRFGLAPPQGAAHYAEHLQFAKCNAGNE
jgi:hypothetical protein